MAHNLYQNKMAFTGEIPWHRLGTHFDKPMNAAEVIMATGMDYEVFKRPLYDLPRDGEFEETGMFATVNSHTNERLGIVGERYTPIQNVHAFDFFDNFIEEGAAIYETAGAIGKGEKIWLLAKLPITFQPVAGDLIEQYCILYNTHDGSKPLSVMFTPIRVVCQNTLNMALKKNTNIVTVKHTSNAEERLAEAGRILARMNDYFTEMGETCHTLAQFKIDDDFIQEYMDLMFGREEDIPTRGPGRSIRLNKIQMFEGRLKNGKGVDLPGVVGTAWHPVQAFLEMGDYDLPKVNEDPTESILFGTSQEFKQRAWDTALALVGRNTK